MFSSIAVSMIGASFGTIVYEAERRRKVTEPSSKMKDVTPKLKEIEQKNQKSKPT